jgi:hypothetical protein
MIRLIALWAIGMATVLLLVILREERLSARGKVPLGRLRRFWFQAERRKAPRYRVDWPMRYRRMEAAELAGIKSRDVSRIGAGIVVPEQMKVGTPIHMELTLPDGAAPWMVIGRVAWSKEVPVRADPPVRSGVPNPKVESAPPVGGGFQAPVDQTRLFFTGIQFQGLPLKVEEQLATALKVKPARRQSSEF